MKRWAIHLFVAIAVTGISITGFARGELDDQVTCSTADWDQDQWPVGTPAHDQAYFYAEYAGVPLCYSIEASCSGQDVIGILEVFVDDQVFNDGLLVMYGGALIENGYYNDADEQCLTPVPTWFGYLMPGWSVQCRFDRHGAFLGRITPVNIKLCETE